MVSESPRVFFVCAVSNNKIGGRIIHFFSTEFACNHNLSQKKYHQEHCMNQLQINETHRLNFIKKKYGRLFFFKTLLFFIPPIKYCDSLYDQV